MVNAIAYQAKAGCQWRLLLHDEYCPGH
ncbi:hypothetical protein CKO36_06000 [Rhabdochromatium marinum]|nr:hypothetical protein [Rhabdochromatium marinum]